jgi:hypothetical protein
VRPVVQAKQLAEYLSRKLSPNLDDEVASLPVGAGAMTSLPVATPTSCRDSTFPLSTFFRNREPGGC